MNIPQVFVPRLHTSNFNCTHAVNKMEDGQLTYGDCQATHSPPVQIGEGPWQTKWRGEALCAQHLVNFTGFSSMVEP